jgi:hypothetical protein
LHSIPCPLYGPGVASGGAAFSAVTRANSCNNIADPRALSRRSTRDQIRLEPQDSVIQCMFWCMLASDITAIYCDILQNLNGSHVFYYVCPMRISALKCSVLQPSKDWTQNPSEAIPWGFDSPSRHHLKYQYHLLNQRLAALGRALCFGCFPVDPALRYEFRYSAHQLYFQ